MASVVTIVDCDIDCKPDWHDQSLSERSQPNGYDAELEPTPQVTVIELDHLSAVCGLTRTYIQIATVLPAGALYMRF